MGMGWSRSDNEWPASTSSRWSSAPFELLKMPALYSPSATTHAPLLAMKVGAHEVLARVQLPGSHATGTFQQLLARAPCSPVSVAKSSTAAGLYSCKKKGGKLISMVRASHVCRAHSARNLGLCSLSSKVHALDRTTPNDTFEIPTRKKNKGGISIYFSKPFPC